MVPAFPALEPTLESGSPKRCTFSQVASQLWAQVSSPAPFPRSPRINYGFLLASRAGDERFQGRVINTMIFTLYHAELQVMTHSHSWLWTHKCWSALHPIPEAWLVGRVMSIIIASSFEPEDLVTQSPNWQKPHRLGCFRAQETAIQRGEGVGPGPHSPRCLCSPIGPWETESVMISLPGAGE